MFSQDIFSGYQNGGLNLIWVWNGATSVILLHALGVGSTISIVGVWEN